MIGAMISLALLGGEPPRPPGVPQGAVRRGMSRWLHCEAAPVPPGGGAQGAHDCTVWLAPQVLGIPLAPPRLELHGRFRSLPDAPSPGAWPGLGFWWAGALSFGGVVLIADGWIRLPSEGVAVEYRMGTPVSGGRVPLSCSWEPPRG